MATETKTFDLSTISNEKGTATYGFTRSGGVLTPANKGVHDSYAYAKLTFDMPADGTLTLGVTQSSEKNYDFGLVSNLDSSLAQSASVDSSVKYNAKGLDGSTTITYTNVTKGSHFITIKYKKDGSSSSGSDAFNITSLVATYVVVVEGETVFNLSALNLEVGTYDITVVAKASGYADSKPSEAVKHTVSESIFGTWKFNDVVYLPISYDEFVAIQNSLANSATNGTTNTQTVFSINCSEVVIKGVTYTDPIWYWYAAYYKEGSQYLRKSLNFCTNTYGSVVSGYSYRDGTVVLDCFETGVTGMTSITVTGAPNEELVLEWLKANATKVS